MKQKSYLMKILNTDSLLFPLFFIGCFVLFSYGDPVCTCSRHCEERATKQSSKTPINKITDYLLYKDNQLYENYENII